MGQLRRRGGVWWLRYYRDGVRHEESSGSDKKGVALDLLRDREGAIAHGVPVSARIARLRFDEAVGDVVNDYKVNRRRSLRDVEQRLRDHLTPVFGGHKMAGITTDAIRAYSVQRQDEGASSASINRELAILRRAFRLAVKARKLLHTPHVPMLQEHNVRSGFFERDQFEAVRAKLPTELRGVVTVGFLTGWRIASEVLPLQWKQIDRRAKIVRLDPGTTKNRDGRVLPYGSLPELADVIETQWTEHERLAQLGVICPWVFTRDGAGPIRQFRNEWRAAGIAAEVPGKLLHDFRRTAVRNLVRAGVPEKIAMGITGHKTRSVFDRYDIVNEADLRTALGRLAAPGDDAKDDRVFSAAGTKKGQSSRVAAFGKAKGRGMPKQ